MLFLVKSFLYLALLAPLILTPSLYFPFITGKALFFRLAVELALLAFGFYLALGGRVNWQKIRHPVVIALSLFALVSAITGLTGVNPQNSWWSDFERGEGVWQIIHYWLFFLLTVLVFNTKVEWQRLLGASILVSFIVSLYGLAQHLNLSGIILSGSGRISGTLGNPSYLAAYLLFHMIFAGYLLYNELNKPVKNRWWVLLLVLILLTELFDYYQTGTKAALIALFVGLSAGFITFWRKSLAVFFASVFCIVLILITLGFSLAPVYLYGALKSRFWTWGSALAGFIEKPWLGWGVENFPYVFDKYYNPQHYGLESWFDRAHNIFLDYLVAGGLPLLTAYLAIFVFYYLSLVKLPKNFFWVVFAVLPIIYLIQGQALFEVLAIYLAFFLFLAFFVNYTVSADWTKTVDASSFRHHRLYLIYGLTALLIFALPVSFYFTLWRPLVKNRLIIQPLAENDPRIIFTGLKKAVEYPALVGQQEAVQQLLKTTLEYLRFLKKDKKPLPQDLIDLNNQMFDRDQGRFVGVKNLYLISGLDWEAGQTARTKELARRGRELAPTRLEFIELLLRVARSEKDEAAAKELQAMARFLRPDLPQL